MDFNVGSIITVTRGIHTNYYSTTFDDAMERIFFCDMATGEEHAGMEPCESYNSPCDDVEENGGCPCENSCSDCCTRVFTSLMVTRKFPRANKISVSILVDGALHLISNIVDADPLDTSKIIGLVNKEG